jgi:hypothetical protein
VKPANLLFEEGGEKEEEERRQEALEKKEAEAASQVIHLHRLSQEKDDDDQEKDDDGLADAFSTRKKNKSKKKKPGHQGAGASQTAPWATEAIEAGGAAVAGVGVEAKSWLPPLQVDVEKEPSIMSAAAVGEAIFMAKFNWSSSEGSSGAAPNLEDEKMPRRVLRASSQQHCSGTQGKQRQPQNERGTRGIGSSGGTSR